MTAYDKTNGGKDVGGVARLSALMLEQVSAICGLFHEWRLMAAMAELRRTEREWSKAESAAYGEVLEDGISQAEAAR